LVFVQQAEQHPENRPYVITWPREKHLEAINSEDHLARLLYEKTGFVVEGVLRDCIQVQGTYESLVIMGILENEYISRT
jgi:hypothetical protein